MSRSRFSPLASRWPAGRISAALSTLIVVVIVGYAIAIPLIFPTDQATVNFAEAYLPPSSEHIFGTDSAGHDLFVRTAQALRISLLIAVITAVCSAVIGTVIGVGSALVGGLADRITMRCVDGMNALPHLILGLVIVSLFKGSATAIVIALVLTHWIPIARITRAQVLHLRNSEFVHAAYLSGRSSLWVVSKHLIPAALGQSMVGFVLLVPHAIWHESTLSFLGVGLPAHRAALGTILRDAQGAILLGGWWILIFPSAFLVLFSIAVGRCGNYLIDPIRGHSEMRV